MNTEIISPAATEVAPANNLPRYATIAGAVLILLGLVLPQATVPFLGGISLWSVDYGPISVLLIAAFALGTLTRTLGFLKTGKTWVPVTAAVLAFSQAVLSLVVINDAVSDCKAEMGTDPLFDLSELCSTVQPGMGIWALALGSIAVITGVVLARRAA